jgi:hypothetical protein
VLLEPGGREGCGRLFVENVVLVGAGWKCGVRSTFWCCRGVCYLGVRETEERDPCFYVMVVYELVMELAWFVVGIDSRKKTKMNCYCMWEADESEDAGRVQMATGELLARRNTLSTYVY